MTLIKDKENFESGEQMMGMEDIGYWILDIRYSILDEGYLILVTGYWTCLSK